MNKGFKIEDGIIVSLIDRPELNVKTGDKGGYICPNTFVSDDSWVAYPSIVVNSHILNGSIVEGVSSLANVTVDVSSEIKDSRITNSNVVHSLVFNCGNIVDSEIETTSLVGCTFNNVSTVDSQLEHLQLENKSVIHGELKI